MDIRKIKKLIELIEKSSVTEIIVKDDKEELHISRNNANVVTATTPIITNNIPAEEIKDKINIDTGVVSPMVGTFYSKPSPDAKPFIKVGQKVKAGDTICIIEAMKIMNQIKSDKSGMIMQIKVADGDAVEFGQLLIVIE